MAWLLVVVVAVAMVAASTALHQSAVVFPEGAALTFGVLVLRLPGWVASPRRLVGLPTLCAVIGVALAHCAISRWIGEIAALAAALTVLRLAGSRLTPAMSAAAFPVVFSIKSWLFPVAVLIVCAGVAAVEGHRAARPPKTDLVGGELGVAVSAATWLLAAVWIVLAGPALGLAAAATAPPLIVAIAERVSSRDASALTGVRHWLALVVAAAAAATAYRTIDIHVLAVVAGLAVVMTLFVTVTGPHPPALAVVLIPFATGIATPVFVVAIAIGAAALYLQAGLLVRLHAAVSERRARAHNATRDTPHG